MIYSSIIGVKEFRVKSANLKGGTLVLFILMNNHNSNDWNYN